MESLKETAFTDQEKVDFVLREFAKLAGIPRKSGHEEAVSNYLTDWAKRRNLCAVQDELKNVIIEKAASEGYETAPRVILQGHMDMVCVSEDGKAYDPLKDGVEIIQDGKYLRANGTSLGADDGIGVAAAMYVLQSKELSHGPLRVIFTVDEENGMTGAEKLDNKYLDAKYLINCDSEDFDIVTIGSAGSVNLNVTGTLAWEPVAKEKRALLVTISGLLGGHSGIMIHEGRANAIKLLALFLRQAKECGAQFQLGECTGGRARNAIAATAQAIVFADEENVLKIQEAVVKTKQMATQMYGGKEAGCQMVCKPAEDASRMALSDETQNRLLHFLWFARHGVQAMSNELEGLVESSANLGVLTVTQESFEIQVFPRSSKDAWLDFDVMQYGDLAKLCGFSVHCGSRSAAWPVNVKSELLPAVKAAFQEQVGAEIKVESIHAGLECSWFYQKNPALDMVSIGPTLTGAHSPQETLHLETLLPHIKVLEAVLARLKA